jgi:hypothetical protein
MNNKTCFEEKTALQSFAAVSNARQLALTQISEPQTMLVDECFRTGIFTLGDIMNLYDTQDNLDDLERAKQLALLRATVSEWLPVTPSLSRRLVSHGACVLSNIYGQWWGRTEEGILCQDPIFLKVASRLAEDIKGEDHVEA